MGVELRLTGAAVQQLADCEHLPGWPDAVDPAKAEGPDRTLDAAAARWYLAATSYRQGRGRVYLGTCAAEDAKHILEYLDSVGRALTSPGVDAYARWEGRRLLDALDRAVDHLRRQGVTVDESARARRGDYHLTTPED